MWYTIYQQKYANGKEPIRRKILLELDTDTYDKAKRLKLKVIIELGDTLAAILCYYNKKEASILAQLSEPGIIFSDRKLLTIQEACIMLIKDANGEPPEQTTDESKITYKNCDIHGWWG